MIVSLFYVVLNHNIRKGTKDFDIPKNCFVCSNHFVDGKPTRESPSPSLFFLTISINVKGTPDRKDSRLPPRKIILYGDIEDSSCSHVCCDNDESEPMELELYQDKSTNTVADNSIIALTFAQITRECDVLTFTGLNGTEMFKAVFNYVQQKAAVMT